MIEGLPTHQVSPGFTRVTARLDACTVTRPRQNVKTTRHNSLPFNAETIPYDPRSRRQDSIIISSSTSPFSLSTSMASSDPSVARESLHKFFNSLDDNDKWKPESYTHFVEDTLFAFIKDSTNDTTFDLLLTSWILPLYHDRVAGELFEDDYPVELTETVHPLPQLSDKETELIDHLLAETEEESACREGAVLSGEFAPISASLAYRRWLTSSVGKYRSLSDQQTLCSFKQPVFWRTVNLWSRVYDDLIQTIPGLTVKR